MQPQAEGPASIAASSRRHTQAPRWREPVAALVGNTLEWFDVGVYALFAATIGRVFFPSSDPNVSLMLAFGTFGATYLIRPVGAVVLGAYADRAGRKKSMTLSLSLMAIGTLMMAAMPSYAAVGVLAPVGVVVARLIQGFSAGGEFGSATAFLTEHAPRRMRALFGSLQFASQGLGTILGSLFGYYLTVSLSASEMQAWGWRIPFLFGLLIVPAGLYVRRAVDETPEFEQFRAGREGPQVNPFIELLRTQKTLASIAVGSIVVSTASTFIIKYMPSYAAGRLGLAELDGFVATLLAGCILTFATPIAGYLADRVGRIRSMTVAAAFYLIASYPLFCLLAARPSVTVLLVIVGAIAIIKVVYYAPLPSIMADIFPVTTRGTGLNLSYNVGVTAFGGFAPLISTALIGLTGSSAAPGLYLVFVSAISIAALVAVTFSLSSGRQAVAPSKTLAAADHGGW
ncbi:MFS transporter [Bradyrhizobium sp. 13971]